MSKTRFEASPFSGYAPRTKVNAENADLTVAFAIDFNTAGERLTHRSAQGKFIALSPKNGWQTNAENLLRKLQEDDVRVLNVAGNGVYTWVKHGWSQDKVNEAWHRMFAWTQERFPVESVRSGGQTGTDWAGLVSATALEVPALGYFPKGFLQRNAGGTDSEQTIENLRKQLQKDVLQLQNAGHSIVFPVEPCHP